MFNQNEIYNIFTIKLVIDVLNFLSDYDKAKEQKISKL